MIVGVTGGIGSGKSTVCRMLQGRGAFLVEADEVGREAVDDEAVRSALVEAFGSDILDSAGELDRRELGRRAFVDRASTDRLNAIVWPALGKRLRSRIEEALHEDATRPVVVDAALLVEWGDPKDLCDVLLVVTADLMERVRRSMKRLGLSEAETRDRMGSQAPEEKKIELADFVIVNNGSLEELERKTMEIWSEMQEGKE